jgi:transcriptional regulator with XRE-family HTH domain
MTGKDLRQVRRRKGWTQQQAAKRLGLSQTYLSMLERDERKLSRRVQSLLNENDCLHPLGLTLRSPQQWTELSMSELATELASLGYPGFAYLRARTTWNPAELLLAALTKENLEARIAEALPWLVLAYNDMNWDWVVRESKLNDVQNRLGFVVTLARELAEKKNDQNAIARLSGVESNLRKSILAQEQTFCNDRMSQAERKWLRDNRTVEARQWNVLSDLKIEHLSHAV